MAKTRAASSPQHPRFIDRQNKTKDCCLRLIPVAGAKYQSELDVAACELLAGLTSGESAEVLRSAHVKYYGRGDLLWMEGGEVREVFLVTAGTVKIMKLALEGDAVIFRLALPGDIIGATSLYPVCGYSTTALSVRHCCVLAWSIREFEHLLNRWPALNRNYVQIQHEHLLEIEERFCEMATKSVSQRLARQLLRLHARTTQLAGRLNEISISREELAQMTGISMFSACRLLVNWETRGLVRSRRETVTVLDAESLKDLAG